MISPKKEMVILREVMLALSALGCTLFRNNSGMGWQGRMTRLRDGSMRIDDPRPLRAGLCTGSADLIGWTPVRVTQAMVGKTLAVFTAVECKTPRGRIDPEQRNFIERLEADGGIGRVTRSAEEARAMLLHVAKPRP